MLGFSSQQNYYLFKGATDMRNQFDGLSGLVRRSFGDQLMSGDVFVFVNRTRNRIKLLMWDGDGFALYYKRLEKGTYKLPVFQDEASSKELSWSDLVMLLEGIELQRIKRRKRYKKAV